MAALAVSSALKEVAVDEQFVWMTTRRIRPGTLAEFERAWRPPTPPSGMLRAYAFWSEDGSEIVGLSFWDSRGSCEAWRVSEAEARRREAMAPFVIEERELFYHGRELIIPTRDG